MESTTAARSRLFVFAFAAVCGPVLGQSQPLDLEPLPDLEPHYRVVPKADGKQTLHEFRVDEKVYGYRVQPRRGAPYYLFDTDNNGVLDRINENDAPLAVPQWELFRWRGAR